VYLPNTKKKQDVLGIHDLFGTELVMIFSFHVGLTDSVMQLMQKFFLSVSVRHFEILEIHSPAQKRLIIISLINDLELYLCVFFFIIVKLGYFQ
jgi:hypothetical protein